MDNPYVVTNRQQKTSAWTKLGYTSPNRTGRSFGFQFHVLNDKKALEYGDNKLSGDEAKGYFNFIYADIIKDTRHKIKTGGSATVNHINNSWNELNYNWKELVIGTFSEYTFSPNEQFSLVSGIRYDYSNIWGHIVTPRIHGRWEIKENNVLRFSGGLGTKNPNPFFENIGPFASNRTVILEELKQEKAINYGVNYTKKFEFFNRKCTLSFDFYRTDFFNKTVVDVYNNYNEVAFYNVENGSFANSFMSQFKIKASEKLDFNIAYRWYEVKTKYKDLGYQDNPFTQKHRGFFNSEFRIGKFISIDGTLNWNGITRISAVKNKAINNSTDFFTFNTQLKYHKSDKFNVYLGAENLFNYQQKDAIINSQTPFKDGFDAGVIWAPIFGRKIYAGIKVSF